MKRFFTPNIDRVGRRVRGCLGIALLVGAWFGFQQAAWLGVILAGSAAFVLFEALRGWCVMRACGIKTKL